MAQSKDESITPLVQGWGIILLMFFGVGGVMMFSVILGSVACCAMGYYMEEWRKHAIASKDDKSEKKSFFQSWFDFFRPSSSSSSEKNTTDSAATPSEEQVSSSPKYLPEPVSSSPKKTSEPVAITPKKRISERIFTSSKKTPEPVSSAPKKTSEPVAITPKKKISERDFFSSPTKPSEPSLKEKISKEKISTSPPKRVGSESNSLTEPVPTSSPPKKPPQNKRKILPFKTGDVLRLGRRAPQGCWTVEYKWEPYRLDLDWQLDLAELKAFQTRFFSLPSFPSSEAERPPMNYPVNICDEKVIKLAIQLGDVYAVKQWIARGNDVNVKCVSEFFDPIAPLECVVKEYDERETCMNVSRWGLHMHRSTTMTDYQDMARALQSAGAKMTSEIQKKAKESRFGRPPHQGLLDLVDRWEDGALVEEDRESRSVDVERTEEYQRLLKVAENQARSISPGKMVFLLCPLPQYNEKEHQNFWRVSYNRIPFLLDLNKLEFHMEEKEHRKKFLESLPSYPTESKNFKAEEEDEDISSVDILQNALQAGNIRALKSWMARGNSINQRCCDEMTPLEYFAEHFNPNRNQDSLLDTTKFLIAVGAKVTDTAWKKALEPHFSTEKTPLISLLAELTGTTAEAMQARQEAKKNLPPEGVLKFDREMKRLSDLEREFGTSRKLLLFKGRQLLDDGLDLYRQMLENVTEFYSMIQNPPPSDEFKAKMSQLFDQYERVWISLTQKAVRLLKKEKYVRMCEQGRRKMIEMAHEPVWREYQKYYHFEEQGRSFHMMKGLPFNTDLWDQYSKGDVPLASNSSRRNSSISSSSSRRNSSSSSSNLNSGNTGSSGTSIVRRKLGGT